jgi:hypothetical protein
MGHPSMCRPSSLTGAMENGILRHAELARIGNIQTAERFPSLYGCRLEARNVAVVIAIVPHVLNGALIALAESVTELSALSFLHGWVTVRLVIVRIHATAFLEVAACRFHAFMKPTALCIAISIRRLAPTIWVVLILRNAAGLSCAGMCLESSRRSQTKSENWNRNLFNLHNLNNLHSFSDYR